MHALRAANESQPEMQRLVIEPGLYQDRQSGQQLTEEGIHALLFPHLDGRRWVTATQAGASYSGRRYRTFETIGDAHAYLDRWFRRRFRAA